MSWDIFVIFVKIILKWVLMNTFLKVLTRILARKNQLSAMEKHGLKNHIDYLRFLWRFNVDFLNQVHECKYPNIKHGNFCVRVKIIWIKKLYPLSIQKVRAKRAYSYFSANIPWTAFMKEHEWTTDRCCRLDRFPDIYCIIKRVKTLKPSFFAKKFDFKKCWVNLDLNNFLNILRTISIGQSGQRNGWCSGRE